MVRARVWYLAATIAALGLLAGTSVPAWAQHGGGHVGAVHAGGAAHGVAVHGGAVHAGGVHYGGSGYYHNGNRTAVVIGLGFGGYPGYYRNYGYGGLYGGYSYPSYYSSYYPAYSSSYYYPAYSYGSSIVNVVPYTSGYYSVDPSAYAPVYPSTPVTPTQPSTPPLPGGGETLPLPVQATGSATVEVRVPADAQVWFDDTLTKQTGEARTFRTPSLPGGDKVFTYRVRARWTDKGQAVETTKEVEVRPGKLSVVDFNKP